jgi:hypothetical protein
MIFKANYSVTHKLLTLPETGMGYQIIDAKLIGKSYRHRYVIYNSELILNLDNQFSEFKQQVVTKGYSYFLNEAKQLFIEPNSISLVANRSVSETRMISESKRKDKHRYSGEKGAKVNPIVSADGNEIFVRLSAYEDDKRIDFQNNKLKDGTYTTTQSDYFDSVIYNDDPIDRYALPNDETIKWTFYVQPKWCDTLQKGIVQPAFGHDGGGIEAYFEYGTSDNTYLTQLSNGK